MPHSLLARFLACAAVVGLLAGCAGLAPAPDTLADSDWARASALDADLGTDWQVQRFPGKAPVRFMAERRSGRDALSADAQSAASMVKHRIHVAPDALGRLSFSWKVPQLIAGADLARRDADDSPVRIVLAFEGDRSRFSPADAMLSELARTLTGEPMPYATLMYVWCNQREPGTVVRSPRTERIRKIVLESGPGRLNQWLDYERDIRADYERAFGEPPGALVGVAVMTDSDNTRSATRAWYGPLQLRPVSAPAR